MKKTLIALAALGAMAGANAQSTVTLYGLVDANIQSFKTNVAASNGTVTSQRQTKIESGGLNGSRWGLRVSEDIGGGMAAVANLESGLALDTGASGQGGLLFGRRANAGISSSSFGTLVIGRNSSSYDDVSADHAMMGASIFDPSNTNNAVDPLATRTNAAGATVLSATNATLLDRNTTWVGFNTRFNNSVKYTTPNFSGFSGSLMYAFGENKTATLKAGKTVSANLKYANGPLLVSGGYQDEALNRVAATVLDETGAPLGVAVTDAKLKNALLNVAYDFGVAKVGAGFNRAKYEAAGGDIAPQKEISLSVAVPLGAATLSAGVARSKGDDLGKSTGVGVQALYSLSKRSTLYAGVQSTKVYDKLAAEVKLAAPLSDIGRVTTYGVGLRHTF